MLNGTNPFFDPAQLAGGLKALDIFSQIDAGGLQSLDPGELMKLQTKNMEALVNANKRASETYKALFEKQIKEFETSVAEVRNEMASFDGTDMTADTVQNQIDAVKTAFDKGMESLASLAAEAQKANTSVLKDIASSIEDGIKEFNKTVQKSH